MGHEVRVRRRRKGGSATANKVESQAAVEGIGGGYEGRSGRLLPWVVGAVAFLIYLRTMTPAMQMGDGTELATAAHVLGIPHPTGYPLYMLMAKLWLTITVAGDAIVRTTILNGLLMAGAVGLTARILYDLLQSIWKSGPDKAALLFAGAGALTVAFLRFHWNNAVVTEVYALQFLLMVLFTRAAQKMDMGGGVSRRGFIMMTVFMALAFAHHRLSVTMVLPWAVLTIIMWRRERAGSGVRLPWVSAALIIAAGLSLYAYLPLRAAVDTPVNWGNPDNLSRFYNHVRGTEYLDRGLLKPALGQEFSAETMSRFTRLQTTNLLSDMVGQFVPFQEQFEVVPGTQKIFIKAHSLVILLGLMLAAAAAWGMILLWRSGHRLFAGVVVAVALQNVVILFVYNIADIRDYFLYPFWAAWLGIFVLAARGSARLHRRSQLMGAYASLLLPLAVLAGNWQRCDRSNDVTAEVLSAAILPESTDTMPSNSILITDDDAETFTTWYRQKVRGDRPDVLNFAGNFVYMPWYETFFSAEQRRDYKITLADGVALSADEYAGQLRTAIIDANVATHPVFTSINDGAVLSVLSQTYEVEPVDAVGIVNRSLFDVATTTVLYRIQVKDQAQ